LELLPVVKRNSHRSSFALRAKVPLCSFLFPLQAKPAVLGFGLVIRLRQKTKKETLKRVSLFLELLPRFTPAGHRYPSGAQANWRTSFYWNYGWGPQFEFRHFNNKKTPTPDGVGVFLELLPRFELGTSSLPRIPEASPLWGAVPLVIKSLEMSDFGCSFSDRWKFPRSLVWPHPPIPWANYNLFNKFVQYTSEKLTICELPRFENTNYMQMRAKGW